jgi:hypothetical protein
MTMKIESYEAKDVVVSRQDIIDIVSSVLRKRYNLDNTWEIADQHWSNGMDLTLVLQRSISKEMVTNPFQPF